MTYNDAVVMQHVDNVFPVLSIKNDGHCHHSCMGVFPDTQLNQIKLRGEPQDYLFTLHW